GARGHGVRHRGVARGHRAGSGRQVVSRPDVPPPSSAARLGAHRGGRFGPRRGLASARTPAHPAVSSRTKGRTHPCCRLPAHRNGLAFRPRGFGGRAAGRGGGSPAPPPAGHKKTRDYLNPTQTAPAPTRVGGDPVLGNPAPSSHSPEKNPPEKRPAPP